MKNCRLVAYSGSGKTGYLIGCKLTREQASKMRNELLPKIVEAGFKPQMVFVEEYTKQDYSEVYANAYRVKVVFRKVKREYSNDHRANTSRVVDRGSSLIYGQGLDFPQAYYLKELAESIYKVKYFKDGKLLKSKPNNDSEWDNKISPVIMESYGKDKIEIHKGYYHAIINDDGSEDFVNDEDYFKFIGKNGKGLQKATTRNLSFTSLGHSRDKDSKWELGQLDFTSYNLSSKQLVDPRCLEFGPKSTIIGPSQKIDLDIACINPYQASGGHTTLPKIRRVREHKQWAGSRVENNEISLGYAQILSLVRDLAKQGNSFSAIAKYLKRMLYIRNATTRSLHDAFFVLNDRVKDVLIQPIKEQDNKKVGFNVRTDKVTHSYIKATNGLITNLIRAAIA